MPETSKPSSHQPVASRDKTKDSTPHTCACGEQHEHLPNTPSHRDACTSPKKFGNSCCCGASKTAKDDQTPCGHGPKCH